MAVTVAVFLYVCLRGIADRPVRQPVRITEGYHLSKDFKIGHESEYEVGLRCKRTLPFDQLDNILQFKLDVTYTVFENGVVVSRVDSKDLPDAGGVYSRDRIVRFLGRFSGSPYNSYRIEFAVNTSHPELDPTEPMLLVELDHSVGAGRFHEAMPFALVGCVSGPVALFYLISAGVLQFTHWIRKRREILSATGRSD